MRLSPLLLFLLLAGGCSYEARPVQKLAAPEHVATSIVQCLRAGRQALVLAEGAALGPAQVGLADLAAADADGPFVIGIDVGLTADAVPVLLRSQLLERDTTGRGQLGAIGFQALRKLALTDPDGKPRRARVASLDEALVWARRSGVLLAIRRQPGVALPPVADAVRQAEMERQVILLTTGPEGARAARAQGLMALAPARTTAEARALAGLAGPGIVAYVDGAGVPGPAARLAGKGSALAARAITPDAGPGLAVAGAVLLTTDQPGRLLEILRKAGRDGRGCIEGERR